MVAIKYFACLTALALCGASMVKQRHLDLSSVAIGLVTVVVILS